MNVAADTVRLLLSRMRRARPSADIAAWVVRFLRRLLPLRLAGVVPCRGSASAVRRLTAFVGRRGYEPEGAGEVGELEHRARFHFLHHAGAVDLDRAVADGELARNLLARETGGHARHDLAFALGQARQTFGHLRAARERRAHALEQYRAVRRLGEEIDRAGLDGGHGHGNI